MIVWGVLSVLAIFLIAATLVLLTVSRRFEPEARKWIISAIQKRYESGVEMGAFHASLYPIPKATVEDLVIRFHGRTDLPPLAKIRRMSVEAAFWGIRQKPIRISQLTLEGLEISIPPKTQRHAGGSQAKPEGEAEENGPSEPHANFVLEHVNADGMVLHLVPGDPTKEPHDFEFEKLSLSSAALDRPMEFHAALKNWMPPGKIETSGRFGPWNAASPGATPLDGKYTFREADLSVFKGISGTLSSDGQYQGRLERIECEGTTDTPDFKVTGKPVDLKTEFRAVVDGTNGDTLLDSVIAHFRNTTVAAKGAVVGSSLHKGKLITLTVDVQKARVEDFLHLLVNSSEPVMTGAIAFHAAFELPPGHNDVISRMGLQGHLNLPSARFTSLRIQDILGNLSRRAEGDPQGEIDEHVASAFSSDFVLKGGEMSFSRLVFDVPGAEVRLSGNYGIHSEEMNFVGQARTEARLSQMTTGVKSKILKFVDPFFARDGAGAVIPIHISGTRSHPKFGLNFGKGKR